jgi:dGTPase
MIKFDHNILNDIKKDLHSREVRRLAPNATLSSAGVRRLDEKLHEGEYRPAFSVDVDRILHSLAYTRYIDKTQVFYLIQNDHITHRVLHVQLVSKIARTIGRFLGLNEDLIEAIALGHDIGHAPFGHDGERHLSEICLRHGIGTFQHNIQSVQFLTRVERKGRGWNLCLQTIDGILCHDGEIHDRVLRPQNGKTFALLDDAIRAKKENPSLRLVPMSLEGCVVRIADTISYIGRDIEDAIRIHLIQRTDLPDDCVALLGNTNGTIVFNLVTNVIQESYQKDHVGFSHDVSEALKKLKRFNLEKIYMNPNIKSQTGSLANLFETLFRQCLTALECGRRHHPIFNRFLDGMTEDYLENHSHAEIVRDFIAGMTDQYFLRQLPATLRPDIQVR